MGKEIKNNHLFMLLSRQCNIFGIINAILYVSFNILIRKSILADRRFYSKSKNCYSKFFIFDIYPLDSPASLSHYRSRRLHSSMEMEHGEGERSLKNNSIPGPMRIYSTRDSSSSRIPSRFISRNQPGWGCVRAIPFLCIPAK